MKIIGTRIFDDLGVPPEERKYTLRTFSSTNHATDIISKNGLPRSPLQFDKPLAPTPSLVTDWWGTQVRRLEGQEWQVEGVQLVCRGGPGYRDTSAGEECRCVPLLMLVPFPCPHTLSPGYMLIWLRLAN